MSRQTLGAPPRAFQTDKRITVPKNLSFKMKFFHVYFAFILLEVFVFVSGKFSWVFIFKIRNIFDVF
jgi:hypothetical protein